MSEVPNYQGFAIVDLYGHQRLAGYIRQEEQFGTVFVRVDVPAPGESGAYTRYLGAASIYGFMPVSEDVARAVAARAAPPVSEWELPRPAPLALPGGLAPGEEFEPEDELDDVCECGAGRGDHVPLEEPPGWGGCRESGCPGFRLKQRAGEPERPF